MDSFIRVLELVTRGKDNHLAYFGRATVWQKKQAYRRALIDIKEAVKRTPGSKKYDGLLFEIKSAKNK